MSFSPTQRTLKAMREQGRVCDIVERNIARPGTFGIKSDFLGFLDLIVLDPEKGIIGIQSCGQSYSEHLNKMTELRAENMIEWMKAGGKVELWGWRKVKLNRGSKAMRWKPRICDFWLDEGENINYKERK